MTRFVHNVCCQFLTLSRRLNEPYVIATFMILVDQYWGLGSTSGIDIGIFVVSRGWAVVR